MRKMVNTGIILTVLLPALIASCGSGNEAKMDIVTYLVNSYRVPCTGVAPMECLQVRKEGSEQWQYFYSSIDGFEYEPGYLYKIRVREEKLDPDDVPADASSIKYILVSVDEKTPDPKLRINDIWMLEEMEGRPILQGDLPEGIERPYIEFQVRENRFMGTDGCNTYRGSMESLTDTGLRLGPAMSTRMACPDMSIPDAYLKLLDRVDSYQLSELDLILLEGDTELLKFRKTD